MKSINVVFKDSIFLISCVLWKLWKYNLMNLYKRGGFDNVHFLL